MVPAIRNGDGIRSGAGADSDAAEGVRHQRGRDGHLVFRIYWRHTAGEKHSVLWRGVARRPARDGIHGVPENACSRFLHCSAITFRGPVWLDQMEGPAKNARLAGTLYAAAILAISRMLRFRCAAQFVGPSAFHVFTAIGRDRTIARLQPV